MAKIKGKDTRLEIQVRKWLHAKHIGYRKNYSALPGKPDMAITRWKTAVFVNGCFWHGHDGCRHFVVPHTRTEWWLEKIGRTAENDRRNTDLLISMGWKVVILWECELKQDFDGCMNRLMSLLFQGDCRSQY